MPATMMPNPRQLTDFASIDEAKTVLRKRGSSPWQEVTQHYRRSAEHLQQLLETLGGKHLDASGILSHVHAMCSICPNTDRRIDSRLGGASAKVRLIHALAMELEQDIQILHGFIEKDFSRQIEHPVSAGA